MYVTVEPLDLHQPCPSCGSTHTFKRGKSKPRYVRHLDIGGNITLLILPTIRLSCNSCNLNSWVYSFVKPKARYADTFANALAGGIVTHSAKPFKLPYTSREHFIKETLTITIETLQGEVLNLANNCSRLVLDIDDFAIKKGHTYNTGIHDLRNASLLTLVKGRKCNELWANEKLL